MHFAACLDFCYLIWLLKINYMMYGREGLKSKSAQVILMNDGWIFFFWKETCVFLSVITFEHEAKLHVWLL